MGGDIWRGLRLCYAEVAVGADGAIKVPANARSRVNTDIVLAPTFNRAIGLYSAEAWAWQLGAMDALTDLRYEARLLVQLVRSNKVTCSVKDDRIHVPAFLNRLANIGSRVLVISAADHLEFWDPETWASRGLDVEASVAHGVA